MKNTTILTKRLRLTPLTTDDIPAIYEMNSFPEVARYNTIGIPANIAATRRLLLPIIEQQTQEGRTKYGWCIRQKETEAFVGEIGIGLASVRFKMGEIYYSLHPRQWGQGFATEAVVGLLDWAFRELELHRIEAGVATGNDRSYRLLERVGMMREGVRRRILPINGQWVDSYLYGLLEEEFRERFSTLNDVFSTTES